MQRRRLTGPFAGHALEFVSAALLELES